MNSMKIYVQSGLTSNGFDVEVYNERGLLLYKNNFRFGYNASCKKEYAEEALRECEMAQVFMWDRLCFPKPYAGDIIKMLKKHYDITDDDLEVCPGKNAFLQREVSEDDVIDFAKDFIVGLRKNKNTI